MKVDTYRRLGELLVERGIVTERQLSVALAEHRAMRRRLGDVLIARGFADEIAIANCLAEQYRHPFVDLSKTEVDHEASKLLRPDDAIRLHALPFAVTEDGLAVAIADPVDLPAADELMTLLRTRLEFHIAPSDQLARRIRFSYGLSDEAPDFESPEAEMGPTRFSNLLPRLRLENALLFTAHDSELDRPVSLMCRPSIHADSTARDEMTRAAANSTSASIWPVFDMAKTGSLTWTMMPPLPVDNLSRVLRAFGPRKLSEAAGWVATLAEELDLLGQCGRPHGWACPENLFISDRGLVLAPLTLSPAHYRPKEDPDGFSPDAAVYGLTMLLKECLYGIDAADKPALPMQMEEILETGLNPVQVQRFGSPMELASALRSYNWSALSTGVSTTMAERAELLKAIDGGLDRPTAKPGFWARLFGREAA